MRECKICHKVKSIEEFYLRKSGRSKGWIFKDCKQCNRERGKKYHLENIERERLRMRRYKENGGFTIAMRKWRERHPLQKLKTKARDAAEYLVRVGKIKKEPCKICGTIKNLQIHHSDYSKPLEFEWFCRKHHGIIEGRYLNLLT